MKTFSQLKKDLKLGVKVETIQNNIKPERNGEIREISIVQTNSIAFRTKDNKDSWLWWGKASDYEYNENIFKVYEAPNKYNKNTRTLLFIYKILN